MAQKKVQDKAFKLKNFRLSAKARRELAVVSKRLGIPEVRIVEELLVRYARTLSVEFLAGTDKR